MTEEIKISDRIDELESKMVEYEPVNCPLIHRFVPGLYIREIFMPADSLVTSQIHKTEHPFVVSLGSAYVKINDKEWELIEAPYTGITKPGTRRVLYIEKDCIWTTFHPIDIKPADDSEEALNEALRLIDEQIIEQHINPLLGGIIKNNNLKMTIQNET